MIIIRLFEILRHSNTCLKTKLNMAAAYTCILLRNSNFIQMERIFPDRNNSLDYTYDMNIIEKFLTSTEYDSHN